MYCPKCGHENPEHARFCGACGGAIEVAEISAATPPRVERPTGLVYAGFLPRFAAWLIDVLVLVAGILVLVMLDMVFYVTAILALTSTLFPWFSVLWQTLYFSFGQWYSFLDLLIVSGPLLYYILLTGLRGQTVGKMAVKIKVVRLDGRAPGIGYAALRETIAKFVSSILFLVGFFWIAWDSRNQGWHDHIARTYVIYT